MRTVCREQWFVCVEKDWVGRKWKNKRIYVEWSMILDNLIIMKPSSPHRTYVIQLNYTLSKSHKPLSILRKELRTHSTNPHSHISSVDTALSCFPLQWDLYSLTARPKRMTSDSSFQANRRRYLHIVQLLTVLLKGFSTKGLVCKEEAALNLIVVAEPGSVKSIPPDVYYGMESVTHSVLFVFLSIL